MPLIEEILLDQLSAHTAESLPIIDDEVIGNLFPEGQTLISVLDKPFNIKMSKITTKSLVDCTGFSITKENREFRLIANCSSCQKEIYEDGKTKYYRKGNFNESGRRNSFFCHSCLPVHTQCKCCGFYFDKGELRLGHCNTCIQTAPNRLISNYSTKIERIVSKMGKSLDKVYFGVELEYESKDYGFDTLIVSSLVKDFAILKRDSSIKQGFEVVSAPATKDVHETLWDNFCRNLPPTVTVEETCGMHVHVSRVRMTDLQVAKILKFVHNKDNYKYISAIAGRESGYHNDFTKPKAWSDGRQGGRAQKDRDRHTAVNCNNSATLEFRIFRSTRSKDIIMKNIEYCYALTRFAQCSNCSLSESKEFQAFYNYVDLFRKDFPYLYKFLTSTDVFAKLRK